MPNIFLCVAWPVTIFLAVMAYRISKKKFTPGIAAIIAGMIGIVVALVSANVIGVWYKVGHFRVSDIFDNLIFIITPYLPQ